MSVIVIHELNRTIIPLRRETIGVKRPEVVRRHGGTTASRSDRAKGGVFVVCGDAVGALEEDEVGDVLVPVVRVEERILSVLLHYHRAGGDRLRRIPAEGEIDGVVRRCIEPLDAEVSVVLVDGRHPKRVRDSREVACTVVGVRGHLFTSLAISYPFQFNSAVAWAVEIPSNRRSHARKTQESYQICPGKSTGVYLWSLPIFQILARRDG